MEPAQQFHYFGDRNERGDLLKFGKAVGSEL